MIPLPPRSTRTDTLCPYTTLFRSQRLVYQLACQFVEGALTGDFGLLAFELRACLLERSLLAAPDLAQLDHVPAEVGLHRLAHVAGLHREQRVLRSEEHTSELQSLMRISYAVFCLKKKTKQKTRQNDMNNNP